MLRTHTCGELRISDIGKKVTLCGWVQGIRDLGHLIFIDLRDRYGITQIRITPSDQPELANYVKEISREFVIQVEGTVRERESKNSKNPTGEIEIFPGTIRILNSSKTPPFTIETETDGGEELRMKFRYLDLRRPPLQKNILLRHKTALETRKYLDSLGFLEIETPFLIKSTPEGARDFLVPSRLNPGTFYALPQSPQTFKQLLMVSGFDRYFQIVRCFRDEDLRADRQPEFTQIDCEMSFVQQEDVLQTFEGLVKHLFKNLLGKELPVFKRLSYAEAMEKYGTDKPDLRFGMPIVNLTSIVKNKDFKIFNEAEYVGGIVVEGGATYTRKQIDELTEFIKRPQIGGAGMVWVRFPSGEDPKSSVDKFYSKEDLMAWKNHTSAPDHSLLLIISGPKEKSLKVLSELRLEVGQRMGLRKADEFACLWITDFPLLEWNEADPNLPDSYRGRWVARHHPFTSPKNEDIPLLDTDPGKVRANAYDMVINGVEVGGGSIRIHDRNLQKKMFSVLGFSEEEAERQFGFLMNAFEYGAPPHGGIAFGFDRLCSLMGGQHSIRDFIAFPKNNAGRDLMIDSPSEVSEEQLKELNISLNLK
ncbi:MAG: aspartate--tRNA ligase [Bacteroidia bacterium]|nr:aspartate--tRNA ligase [Bacteroidia bacterium]